MNKIYKLKFDKRRNELVVVSEITVGMGKEKSTGHLADLTALSPFRKLLGTLTPLAFLSGLIISLFPGVSLAAGLPTGGQVVGGQGSISTSGNQMTIHQQTQNMATNWQSFNIGKNNTVQFVQPDSSSVALNRVTGASGSQIMGTLKANGQVFILNPNGVLFGKDARVNVAGLVASTKNINTADFMKGQYTLSGEGNPGAQVVNQGSLTTTKGGYIVLAGERVSNSGTITSPSGKTVLAAGKTVTLQLDNGGLTSVSVDGSVVNALVENHGLISATDGRVYLTAKGQSMLLNTVVNNSGTVEAKGLASRGGEIVLDGGDSGVVSQSGQLLADSHTGQGGKITLEGQNIHLAANSLTSATGKTGGGEVFVGGGWQGKDSRIKNASKVVMDKTATVDVSATDTGNGGTAVLWSDDYTNFRGTILARGGAQSGNGGQVETSSHDNLQAFGTVDASAQAGHGGDWLLDPTDVTIVSVVTGEQNITESGKGTSSALDTDTDHIFSPSASGAQILNTSIENQLNSGTNVTVRTSGTDTEGESGNITLNAAVAKTAGADAALKLEADGNITINNSITSTDGKLDISLLGAGSNTGSVWVLNSTLASNGGNITLGQLNHTVPTAEGPQINQNALGVKISNSTLNAANGGTNGNITVLAYNPGVDLTAAEYTNTVRNGGSLLEVSGGSTLSGGNITLSGEQSGSAAKSLPVFLNGTSLNATGDINISGKGVNGALPASIEFRGTGNNLTAGNNITISNLRTGTGGGNGVFLNGSSTGAVILTAGKDIILNGSVGGNGNGVQVTNATLNSSGNLTLTGSATTGAGVNVTGSTLNAASANITGCSTSGIGFSLTSTTLEGNLTDLTNVTLSSNGSGAGVINILDSSVVNDTNRDTLMSMSIENMTQIDMNGSAAWSGTGEWEGDYGNADNPNSGWIFNNTTINATSVNLSGVGFTNSTLNISTGGLDIHNNGSLILTNNNVSVTGSINLTSRKGNITLSGGNISASGNISINGNASVSVSKAHLNGTDINISTPCGTVSITGGSEERSVLNATGNISIDGKHSAGYAVMLNQANLNATGVNITGYNDGTGATGGVSLTNANISGQNITVNGTSNSTSNSSLSGVMNNGGVNLTAANEIYVNAYRRSNTNNADYALHHYGAMNWNGNNSLSAKQINLNGTGYNPNNNDYGSAGIMFGDYSAYAGKGGSQANVSFNGDTNITGTGKYGIFLANRHHYASTPSSLIFTNGTVNLNSSGQFGFYTVSSNHDARFEYKLNNATLNINTVSTNTSYVGGFGRDNLLLSIKGNGNLNITGKSAGGNAGIDTRNLNISNLNGSVALNGTSASGTGVLVRPNKTYNNIAITGHSTSGYSVEIKDNVTISNGTINGTSNSGNAVVIQNNVNISNGTINGTSGQRAGVVVNGHTHSFTDVSITGQGAGSGHGVATNSISGSNITICGTATGSGDGVLLNNASLSNISINGNSTGNGSGVTVSANSTLTNTTVSGTTADGTGVAVTGNLTSNGNTTVNASATGNGTALALNNATINASGYVGDFSINATAGNGTAISTTGSNTLTSVVLNGTGTGNGSAVVINGTLSTDEEIIATSQGGNGTGLVLNGGKLIGTASGDSLVNVIVNASDTGTVVHVSEGDSELSNVSLNTAANNGNGTTLDVSGNLTSNVNISVSTNNGTALNFSGGSIQGADGATVTVNATATGATGSAVKVEESHTGNLNNVTLNASATEGNAVSVGGTLNTENADISTQVSGNGTALNVNNGTIHSAGNTTVNATATATSGQSVVINNGTLNGGSEGDLNITATTTTGEPAVNISGSSEVTNSQISGHNNGSNSAVVISGNLTSDGGGEITGQTVNGSAVEVMDDSTVSDIALTGNATGNGSGVTVSANSTLTNTTVSGTTADGTGVAVTGNLTSNGNTTVSGNATANGTGIDVSGNVTGGSLTGNATGNGSGVTVSGANSTLTNTTVSGTTADGTGVAVTGNLT
uniref:two-partner secretion domain-containing protein n=1 Tax=Salmonella enterica TaxID=28901 RepID=UPI0009B0029C